MENNQPIKVFIAYSREDESFLVDLKDHLQTLIRQQVISVWFDREIKPGDDWDAAIKANLKSADLILLLFSLKALNSDYLWDTELKHSLARHKTGEAIVVPVILRPCQWKKVEMEGIILGNIHALPTDGKPVSQWPDKDDAYLSIADGVDELATKLRRRRFEAFQKQADEAARILQAEKMEQARLQKEKQDAEQARLQKEREAVERIRLQKEKEIAERIRLQKEKEEAEARLLDPFYDELIEIQGGTFEMGSNETDSEKPIHKVTVPPFWMQKTQVTQAQWKAVMGENPSHFKGENLPVECVSWDEVQVFLKKLNALTCKKYRLPSEAEWEFAAYGGVKSKGFKFAGSNELKEVGWFNENSGSKTHPVAQLKANELGLFDMTGNVWEWCEDKWHNNYCGAPTDGSAWIPGKSTCRVVRGGSWGWSDINVRSAFRLINYATGRSNNFGFRVAHDSAAL